MQTITFKQGVMAFEKFNFLFIMNAPLHLEAQSSQYHIIRTTIHITGLVLFSMVDQRGKREREHTLRILFHVTEFSVINSCKHLRHVIRLIWAYRPHTLGKHIFVVHRPLGPISPNSLAKFARTDVLEMIAILGVTITFQGEYC